MRNWILALLLVPLAAFGADRTVTWTNATENTDGSAIGTIQSTTVVWGATAAALSNSQTTNVKVVTGTAQTTTITLNPGTYYTAAYHTTANGKSGLSNVFGPFTIAAPVPAPPSGLTVVASTAFTSVKQRDAYVMVPVGTVAPSTTCLMDQGTISGGVTYYAVPRASVSFSASVRPEIVFAQCS